MSTSTISQENTGTRSVPGLRDQYLAHRQVSNSLTDGLSAEDMVVQSMEDASPTKWHLAHTTWFFEEFVLSKYLVDFRPVDPAYRYLFNSYYNSVGDRYERSRRGMLTRPGLQQVRSYRQAIDGQMSDLLDNPVAHGRGLPETVIVGLHHEMQHQELMLTDIIHALSINPLKPAIKPAIPASKSGSVPGLAFIPFDEGVYEIGAGANIGDAERQTNAAGGDVADFSFDCEGPKHKTYLQAFSLANRPVTNGEWMAFIDDRGYRRPELWLSDGWALCRENHWQSPLYWQKREGRWFQFSVYGSQPVNPDAPVCHISYFEADAYARWAGARLPTEQEWEVAARQLPIAGNFQENATWTPRPALGAGLLQMYGDVWEWTRSAYSPYPGYRPPEGAIGEYNGKFMCGQFVLKGGSCVTPIQQIRPSYRNFFYPHQRWQFSGLRLAKDVEN